LGNLRGKGESTRSGVDRDEGCAATAQVTRPPVQHRFIDDIKVDRIIRVEELEQAIRTPSTAAAWGT
jgi:uncharacterized protein involved in copper resistance